MREGFSRPIVVFLLAFFAVLTICMLAWFAYFSTTDALQLSAVQGLWLTAALSAGVAISSGLLSLHYRREEYAADAEVFFRVCLIVSAGILLCSGSWVTLILLF